MQQSLQLIISWSHDKSSIIINLLLDSPNTDSKGEFFLQSVIAYNIRYELPRPSILLIHSWDCIIPKCLIQSTIIPGTYDTPVLFRSWMHWITIPSEASVAVGTRPTHSRPYIDPVELQTLFKAHFSIINMYLFGYKLIVELYVAIRPTTTGPYAGFHAGVRTVKRN